MWHLRGRGVIKGDWFLASPTLRMEFPSAEMRKAVSGTEVGMGRQDVSVMLGD